MKQKRKDVEAGKNRASTVAKAPAVVKAWQDNVEQECDVAKRTYFVMLPFSENLTGDLMAEPGRECESAEAAKRAAQEAVQGRFVGAVAFSRRGDSTTGDYEDAEILLKAGRVPDDLAALCGE